MRGWGLYSLFSMLLPFCLGRNEVVFSENQAWNFEVTFDADGNAHYTAMNEDGTAPYRLQADPGTGGTCTFSYNESLPNGPSKWKDLCGIEWQACGLYRQSPVDLLSEKAKKKDSLYFREYYDQSTDGAVENNHHTVVAVVRTENEGGRTQKLTGGPLGQDYELVQFHYHTPSEHLLEGVEYPLELHLVHKSLSNPQDYAVIGFMFDISRDYSSPVLANLMQAAKAMNENQTIISWNIPLHNQLLPANQSRQYFNYLGSLTTPPCAEVVTWYVMTTPLHASSDQLEYFRNYLGKNARPILDIGNRVVTLYTPALETIYHGKLPPGAIAGITLLLLFLFFGVIAYFVFSVKHTRIYFLGKDTGWNYVGLKNGFVKKGAPIEAQDEGSEDDDAPVQRKRTKGKREAGTELAAMDESDRGAQPLAKPGAKKSEEAESDEDTRPRHEERKDRSKGDIEDGGIGGKKAAKKVEDDDDDYIPPAKKTAAKPAQKGGRRGS